MSRICIRYELTKDDSQNSQLDLKEEERKKRNTQKLVALLKMVDVDHHIDKYGFIWYIFICVVFVLFYKLCLLCGIFDITWRLLTIALLLFGILYRRSKHFTIEIIFENHICMSFRLNADGWCSSKMSVNIYKRLSLSVCSANSSMNIYVCASVCVEDGKG